MSKLSLIVFFLFCSVCSLVQAGYSTRIRCGETAGNKWINLVQVRSPFECIYTIRPYSMFVCQLKVEFSTNMPQPLEPTSPSGIPVCPYDARIQIGRFTICGYNNKQHLHIKFDGSYLSSYETIRVSSTSGTYKMKVTQITCPLPPEPVPQIVQKPQQPEVIQTEATAVTPALAVAQLPEVTQTVVSGAVTPSSAVAQLPEVTQTLVSPAVTPASATAQLPEATQTVVSSAVTPALAVAQLPEFTQTLVLPTVTPALSVAPPECSRVTEIVLPTPQVAETANQKVSNPEPLQGLPTEFENSSSSPIELSTAQAFITDSPAPEFQDAVSLQTDPPLTEQVNPAESIYSYTTPPTLTKEIEPFPHLLLKRSARYQRWADYPRRRSFDMLRFDTYILAPEGCDQYYSSPKGFVESLNWNYGRGPYAHSMQYTVCFKAPPRTLELFLSVLDFELGYNYVDNQIDDACNSTSPGVTTDYIQFQHPVNVQDTQLSANVFCGTILQGRTLRVQHDGFTSFTFRAGTNPGIAPVNRVFKFRYGYRYGGYS